MVLLRKRLIPLALFVWWVVFPFGLLQAQGSANSPYIPSIIPPSPNAAALMKFTDVPVSPYTGTADVTVPIYTIKAKGITVPVSLAYHTGGIRLSEEASMVGLGWALNVGGMISRTIMGHDDFGTQGDIYLSTGCPQLAGDISPNQVQQFAMFSPYFFDFWCNYQVVTSSGTEDLWPAFLGGGDIYDMEPDIFSYNFAGHSGKFILTRAGKVVMQKQENIRIQFQGSGTHVTFTVTDDQGNTFYFNVTEQVVVSGPSGQISSWLLSKIVTQQQDSILFNYVSGGATASSVGDAHETYATYCTAVTGFDSVTAPAPLYYNETLQSIDFPAGHLQLAFDSSRSDLYGAYKLDSLLIYSKTATGALTYLKQDNLYYSYFNPTEGASSGTPQEYYRLKLDSVKEKSGSGMLPPYAFTYNNPNPGLGTQKHAFNVDHWGYYNGASNTVLIPTMSVGYQPNINEIGWNEILSYSGANRQPDFSSLETFSLQQITYPTGGRTVLSYQPNDYDYTNSTGSGTPAFSYVQTVPIDSLLTFTSHGTMSGTINLTNIYPVIADGQEGYNVTVNVAFRYLKNDTFPYSNYSGKIYFNIGGIDQDIHAATCSGNVCTSSWTGALAPGIYSWTGNIDASIDTVGTFAGIYVSVHYQETQQVYNLLQNNSEISPASGLRIQQLTNYKDATTIASERVYSYTYLQDKLETGTPQQYSYGRLMSIPSYARYWITSTSQGGYCTALALYSSTITGLTSVIQGNIVGYDQVTETSVDPLTGQDIGKTVYTYYNNPDTAIRYNGYSIPGVLNMGDNLNGSLLSKKEYTDNDGLYSKVTETDNYYHTTNRSVYYSPKYQYFPFGYNGALATCTPDTGVETQTEAWFYPSIKSERVLLDSSRTILYQQGDTTKSVATTQASFYDNPVHYQLTRSRTIDSKGDTLITRIKYPQDYIPGGQQVTGNTILDSLIGRNIVSETIEKQDSLYYPGSAAGYITGAQLNLFRIGTNYHTLVPDRTYKLSINSPVTNFQPFAISGNTTSLDSRYRQMVSFDLYDANNNLQQYTPIDQNPVTYLWDYLHVYPIAQVKNAGLADIAATSFEADGTGNWVYSGGSTADTTTVTGNYCYNLNQEGSTISKSGLTSGSTYVLSYWIKGTSPLALSGLGTPVQGKTIKGWTYYEYTFTGQSTLSITGSAYIDELRLYPASAQMTTYTYTPLVGMTTTCDVDNRVTYYFYDAYQRLKRVKDQDGNIIKTFQYHYTNQNPFNQ